MNRLILFYFIFFSKSLFLADAVQKGQKTLTEIIVELTTLISEKSTHREVEQTTREEKSTMQAKVADIVGTINNYRTGAGLRKSVISDELCFIAGIRTFESTVCWSCTRPNGKRIGSLLDGSDIRLTIVGENPLRHKNAPAEYQKRWNQLYINNLNGLMFN